MLRFHVRGQVFFFFFLHPHCGGPEAGCYVSRLGGPPTLQPFLLHERNSEDSLL